MEALMSTPVSISELLIGKLVPYFILALLSMALCVAVSIWFYQVPFRGSFLALGIISCRVFIYSFRTGTFDFYAFEKSICCSPSFDDDVRFFRPLSCRALFLKSAACLFLFSVLPMSFQQGTLSHHFKLSFW